MIEIKQPEIPPLVNEVLLRVVEINEQIVRQNALIVQALTLPAMIIKRDNKDD